VPSGEAIGVTVISANHELLNGSCRQDRLNAVSSCGCLKPLPAAADYINRLLGRNISE